MVKVYKFKIYFIHKRYWELFAVSQSTNKKKDDTKGKVKGHKNFHCKMSVPSMLNSCIK